MNNKIKIIIALIVYLTLPVVMAYIVAKLFVEGKGMILAIIFFSIIALELIFAALKVRNYIKYNKK